MASGAAAATRTADAPPAPARPRLASFEARVAATAIDALALLLVAAALAGAGALNLLLSSDFERVNASAGAVALFWALTGAAAPVCLLSCFVCLAVWGRTAGGAVMGIGVTRADGEPLGAAGALARVAGMLVYALMAGAGAILAWSFRGTPAVAALMAALGLLGCAAGLLWAVADGERRALHDRLADTIVVRREARP